MSPQSKTFYPCTRMSCSFWGKMQKSMTCWQSSTSDWPSKPFLSGSMTTKELLIPNIYKSRWNPTEISSLLLWKCFTIWLGRTASSMIWTRWNTSKKPYKSWKTHTNNRFGRARWNIKYRFLNSRITRQTTSQTLKFKKLQFSRIRGRLVSRDHLQLITHKIWICNRKGPR